MCSRSPQDTGLPAMCYLFKAETAMCYLFKAETAMCYLFKAETAMYYLFKAETARLCRKPIEMYLDVFVLSTGLSQSEYWTKIKRDFNVILKSCARHCSVSGNQNGIISAFYTLLIKTDLQCTCHF